MFISPIKNNIEVPDTYIDMKNVKKDLAQKKIKFPLVIKPRFGMGSKCFFLAENLKELNFFYNFVKKEIKKNYIVILSKKFKNSVIVQQFIEGDEYNLDVFNDFNGNHILTVPKRKIEMRSGETDSAQIVYDKELSQLGCKISSIFKHRGNLDIDLIKKNNKCIFLEINARFGGGYPFTHLAGAKFANALIDLVNEKKVLFKNIDYNIIGVKTIEPIVLEKN